MEIISNLESLLPLLFFIVAFVYSSVGLGGGSSYTALMAVSGFSIIAIPLVSLSLNVIVTSVSAWNYLRNDHGKLRIILPFLFSAIPFAYFGGMLDLDKEVFLWILLWSLVVVAFRIYLFKESAFKFDFSAKTKIIISVLSGSLLGLVAGIVGIGGGVYLVPLIIMLRLGTAKEAAAAGVVFVWMVSMSGLIPRMQFNAVDMLEYIPLMVAVVVGGITGSYLGSFKLNPKTMEKVLGVVILFAIGFLIKKLLF
jgi:uncharacterized membrane protein YfcA